MQKVIRYLFSLLVLLAYMVTSIGFGVHECSAKGTKHILLINSDMPCEQIHNHCSCSSDSCSSDKHSNNCCSTEIHHLDIAYDITEAHSGILTSYQSLDSDSPLFALNISFKTASDIIANLQFKHGPPIYPKSHQILSSLAQWRL